jgi:hypothetical protein
LVIAISLAGCKKEPVSTEDALTQPAAGTQAETSRPALATIKLLKRGSEPRRSLRWSPAPGRQERLKIRVDTELDMRVALLKAKQAPWSVTFELTVRTNEAVREGTAVFSFTVDEASAHHAASVPPKTRKDREEAMATMRGWQGSYRVDSFGAVHEVVIDVPADASREVWSLSADLEWALRQLAAPFPAEPIGAGATWTVDLGVEQDGVTASEISTLEITKLQQPLITIKRDVRQSAAPQTFRNPGSPTEVELTEFTAEGAGVINWDLTQPLPHSAKMTSTVTKHITYGFEGKRVQSTILTRRALTVTGLGH